MYSSAYVWAKVLGHMCDIAGDGKDLEIGFNCRYLLEALRAVPTEEVTLELTNGLSPIVLSPCDGSGSYSYMRALVSSIVTEQLTEYLEENPAVGKIILDKAMRVEEGNHVISIERVDREEEEEALAEETESGDGQN